MKIRQIDPFDGSHRRWRLHPDTPVTGRLGAYGVEPRQMGDALEWHFEADGEQCAVWRMNGQLEYSAFAPFEVLRYLGFEPYR